MESVSGYHRIRDDILAAINRFALLHQHLGHFLMAVLSNDLREAVGRADGDNGKVLPELIRYCHNEIPGLCWGSKEKVQAWLEMPPEKWLLGLMAPETQKEIERQEEAGIWGTSQFKETETFQKAKELKP